MPLKCCVPKCNSNYKTSAEAVSVYKFPKDEEEKKKWLRVIPRVNMTVTKYTAVCKKHWPESCKMVVVHGKSRPADPPSIFKNIPSSCFSSPPPKVRKIEKISAAVRNSQPDELSSFQELDMIVFEEIPAKFSNDQSVVVYKSDSTFVVQSINFYEGIPEFHIVIREDLSFVVYHYGTSCSVPTLRSNNIKHVSIDQH